MQVNIIPKLLKSVPAPANKSWIIRYMIVSRVKGFECCIRNINLCDDVLACMDCLDNAGGLMDAGESATVLRLLVPWLIKKYGRADFICRGNLINRPLGPYEEIFNVKKEGNILHFEGSLKDKYFISSSISSQFASGLLIAGAELEGEFVSGPYIEMTKKVLSMPGPFDVEAPADETLSAYFKIGSLEEINPAEEPDMVPPYALQCALSPGDTLISDIGRLRFKECDRVRAMAEILCKLGGSVEELKDGLLIHGKEKLQGGVTLDSYNDHRMVMMAAAAAQFCQEPVKILNAECVSKSYPAFFEAYEAAGGEIYVSS